MIKDRLFLFYLFLLFSTNLCAQQFGGNPPSIQWRQVNNDTVRVIFPSRMEKQATQVASITGALSRATLASIGTVTNKINIVFQNQTTIANGYVQLAPFRSEFELTPSQNSFELGSLPWPQQLVIHEYRHVQQYNNYRVGLSKVFYYLFGQSGQELANNLAVPNWFWEGDAVFQETLVSRQGRGRLPAFFNGYRSLWAGGKDYSWMKLRNGSLKDYTPDHYPLGYMLVAYGREKYGEEFWKHASGDAAAFKGLWYPLQKGIRKYSGLSYDQFRQAALNHFSEPLVQANLNDPAGNYARSHKHFVADEEFPQFTDSTHILYVRSSYRHVHSFVIRDLVSGEEKIIRIRSVSLDNYFSYRNHRIVYAAYEPDIRWGWRDYSVLRIIDLPSGHEKKISLRSKYFSPDISADGRQVVAVRQDPDGNSSLEILNAITGLAEISIPNKEQLVYTYPKFYDAGHILSAVRNQNGQMALGLISKTDGSVDWLSPFNMNVIGFPSVNRDTIYFTASHNGKDQLFCVIDHQIYHAISALLATTTGNYQLQAAVDQYAWIYFTAAGYKSAVAPRSKIQWQPISPEQFSSALVTQSITALDRSAAGLLDQTHINDYPVSPYPSTLKLVNFHSWRPYIADPDYQLALVSENVMSTLQSEVFVGYNRNEHSTQIGTDATYGALYPWISGGFDFTFGRNAIFNSRRIYWNEAQARIGLSVPLNLSKGKWNRSLKFGSDLVYNQPYFNGQYKSFSDSFGIRSFAYVAPKINFINQSQMARQQINPSWAQAVALSYERATTQFTSHQFLASGYFYFPGITPTQSLVLSAAFQQRDSTNHIQFTNNFPFSRGYSAENFYQLYRLGVNYHFPLAYPDWGFANLLYFLRIRANLFYDYTMANDFYSNGAPFRQNYRSLGTEIYFDTRWWNQLPISFGIRYSRLLDPDFEGRGPNQWQFILPLTLLGK